MDPSAQDSPTSSTPSNTPVADDAMPTSIPASTDPKQPTPTTPSSDVSTQDDMLPSTPGIKDTALPNQTEETGNDKADTATPKNDLQLLEDLANLPPTSPANDDTLVSDTAPSSPAPSEPNKDVLPPPFTADVIAPKSDTPSSTALIDKVTTTDDAPSPTLSDDAAKAAQAAIDAAADFSQANKKPDEKTESSQTASESKETTNQDSEISSISNNINEEKNASTPPPSASTFSTPSPINPEHFYSIGEAAQLLHVSIDTLRRWEQKGTIHAARTAGKLRRFQGKELLDYIKEEKNQDTLLPISDVAKKLGVSIQTLRRWDKSGRLKAERAADGARMYPAKQVKDIIANGLPAEVNETEGSKGVIEEKQPYTTSTEPAKPFSEQSSQANPSQANSLTPSPSADTANSATKPPKDEGRPAMSPHNDKPHYQADNRHKESHEGRHETNENRHNNPPHHQPEHTARHEPDHHPANQSRNENQHDHRSPHVPEHHYRDPLVSQTEKLDAHTFAGITLAIDKHHVVKTPAEVNSDGVITRPPIEDHGSNTAGRAVLPKGNNKVVIKTKAVDKDNFIFVTPLTNTIEQLCVPIAIDKEGFAVVTSQPTLDDIKFNWIIIAAAKT